MIRASLLVIASIAVPVVAQSVSVDVIANSTIDTQAVAAGVTVSQSLPAGPLPASGSLTSYTATASGFDSADAGVFWVAERTQGREELRLSYTCQGSVNASTSPAFAGGLYHEVVFELTAPSTRMVEISGIMNVRGSAGVPLPQLYVDFGADGSVEWPGFVSTFPLELQIGVQPTRVLIQSQGTVSTSFSTAWFFSNVELTVRPLNDIDINTLVGGCAPFLLCEQALAHDGIHLDAGSFVGGGFGIPVAVLGLAAQPLLLPGSPSYPCLLLPSPDLLLVIGSSGVDLPIPDAVRPITVFTQGVLFDAGALYSSDGYRVYAD